MTKEAKIRLLETRLKNLMASEKDNQGVCRRIRREIRNLENQRDSEE